MTWEYLREECTSEPHHSSPIHQVTVSISPERLNELGNDGWELVAAKFCDDEIGKITCAIFKRPGENK